MSALEACTSCAVAVTPATAFMSESGALCATCFGRWEIEQRAARSTATVKDAVFLRLASELAVLHGVNWGVALILLAGWVPVPGWLSSALLAVVFVIAFALRFRSGLAFRAALILDTVGALALLVVSLAELGGGRLLFLLVPVLFGGWLARLTWRARDAFEVTARF